MKQSSFWIHAYGAEIGTLNLGIGNSPTGPFTTVFSTSGETQTSNIDLTKMLELAYHLI